VKQFTVNYLTRAIMELNKRKRLVTPSGAELFNRLAMALHAKARRNLKDLKIMKTKIELPVKDNPQHVKNLETIGLLEQQGFEGIDASLEISLFEYGIAWRKLESETLFIYSIGKGSFDRVTVENSVDVEKEWSFADFKALMSSLGMAVEEWRKMPLAQKVSDLVSYYGFENIFGASYWEGFEIHE